MKPNIEVDINDTLNTFVCKKRGKKNTKAMVMQKSEKVQKKKVQEKATTPEKAQEKATTPEKGQEKATIPEKAQEKATTPEKTEEKATTPEGSSPPFVNDQHVFDVSPGMAVSLFDYSVDNHFEAIDTICRLSGESQEVGEGVVNYLSSSVIFLREWRHFNYPPRVLRFACQKKDNTQAVDVHGEIKLPQFSAATVPKNNDQDGSAISLEMRKDFVMNVGGLVWALDWCPRVHQKFDSQVNCEFIAVAAHPPESSYHKIGIPLVGRGLIQIWCLLNSSSGEEDEDSQNKNKDSNKPMTEAKSSEPKKPRGRPKKVLVTETELSETKRPRGRPKKVPITETEVSETKYPRGRPKKVSLTETKLSETIKPGRRPRKSQIDIVVEDSNDSIQCVEALAVESPGSSSHLLLTDRVSTDSDKYEKRVSARNNKGYPSRLLEDDSELTSPLKKSKLKDKTKVVSVAYTESLSFELEPVESSVSILKRCTSESRGSESLIPKAVTLPRVVLCLAHNEEVAWDVKWRPNNVDDNVAKHRLGYLAVLLGKGALEVWEVPSLQTVKAIYSTRQKEGTDPRFLKLKPVFRCSKVKCGDRQSIPITLEWSTSAPHDLIMVGCHDGVVALWKFVASRTPEGYSRPLLCFSADTVPIRTLAWAPSESGPESANVVVTAGHKGLKFWDIRDPSRPLWELNPIQRNIFSLDWLPDPRCIIVSYDDGTLRILSLVKAACDVPVTGKPFDGTQQQGFYSYYCSSFAIWSVQVSRLTGMVAYCGADGTVLQFQLTHKAVEKDPHRNRAPHFLCGSLSEEKSAIVVTSPLPDTPFPMKKSLNEWANAPRTIRGFLSKSNQAKRAKENMVKRNTPADQPLGSCRGDDPGTGSESEDLMVPHERKQTTKTKAKSKEKAMSDIALVCGEEEREDRGKGETRNETEKLPSKLVSMHRVRWNMNKGSEKWLSSGGAAGIVRVQEIQKPFSPQKYNRSKQH